MQEAAMLEAVIVSTARTPLTKAHRGEFNITPGPTLTLGADEFMRRFLLHVLPGSFHHIRHYGLLANGGRKANLELARTLLGQPSAPSSASQSVDNEIDHNKPCFMCSHCGAAMFVVQTFVRGQSIRAPPEHPSVP
jgi:Putative transposase